MYYFRYIMFLSYRGITSKHVIFSIGLFGGEWEYTPPVILSGLLVRPEAIQAPHSIPGGTVIGSYTVPVEGVALDYVKYEPLSNAPETIPDLYDVADWQQLIANILCREIWGYYLLPGETPETQPAYGAEWDDDYGYKHLIPMSFGDTPVEQWFFAASNEYVEGMVMILPFASIVNGMTNDTKPNKWSDGRQRCLEGGGYYNLVPRFCTGGCNFAGYEHFCISSLPSWDGQWHHGYGNSYYDRCQMADEGTQSVEGFEVRNLYDTVVGNPFYGGSVYDDEHIDVKTYQYSTYEPDRPKILPIPNGVPGKGENVSGFIAGIGLLAQFLPTLTSFLPTLTSGFAKEEGGEL